MASVSTDTVDANGNKGGRLGVCGGGRTRPDTDDGEFVERKRRPGEDAK